MNRAFAAAVTAALAVLLLAGCEDAAGTAGIVQDRRESPGNPGIGRRELCIGDSRESCRWVRLTSKAKRRQYERCVVGARFPDCKSNSYKREVST